MASSVGKELEKHLECGICLDKFEDPKVLTCQHLYCKKCLERLVTRHEITCPECRRKTKVPGGDVKSLPSNFLINNLLSIHGNQQPSVQRVSPPCKKHAGETLKLFCKDCDQIICRQCAVVDHRNHKYTSTKDIFPDLKKEILEVVQKSRVNIRSLESSIETIKEQEDDMRRNSTEVQRELNSFFDKQIEMLELRRQCVKDDLQKSINAQKKILDAQMDSFQTSLDCLKSSVDFVEQALATGSEVEILSAKNQMIQQLSELNLATSDLKPRGRIYYTLEADWPLYDNGMFEDVAKISIYDEHYYLEKVCCLERGGSNYQVRPRSKSNTFDLAEKVEVKIMEPGLGDVQFPIVTSRSDGSFSFSYGTGTRNYKIEVIVDGRYVHGSPFNSQHLSVYFTYPLK